MSISDNVLKTIEENNIAPVARWKFVIRNIALWTLVVVSMLIGALAVGTLLHIIHNNDWDIYEYLGKTLFTYVTTVFPYLWLFAAALFLGLTYAIVRQTKTGYRYATLVFFAIILLVSVMLGTVFYLFGVGKCIDEALLHYIPAYTDLPHNEISIWNSPGLGLLSGTITEIVNDNVFVLEDFSHNEWVIIEDDADWRRGGLRTVGSEVKLIGAYENEQVFVAREIRPWEKAR